MVYALSQGKLSTPFLEKSLCACIPAAQYDITTRPSGQTNGAFWLELMTPVRRSSESILSSLHCPVQVNNKCQGAHNACFFQETGLLGMHLQHRIMACILMIMSWHALSAPPANGCQGFTLLSVHLCSPPLDEGAPQDPQGGPLRLLPHLPQPPPQEALQNPQRRGHPSSVLRPHHPCTAAHLTCCLPAPRSTGCIDTPTLHACFCPHTKSRAKSYHLSDNGSC